MRKRHIKSISIFAVGFGIGLGSHFVSTDPPIGMYSVVVGFIILLSAGMASQKRKSGTIGWVNATPRNIKKLHGGKMDETEFNVCVFGASIALGAIIGVAIITT